MPIVSAVLTLSQTSTLRAATLTALRSTPAVTLGEKTHATFVDIIAVEDAPMLGRELFAAFR